MKHGLFRKVGWLVLAIVAAGFSQTEDYSQWTYHKPVRINTMTAGGGAGLGSVQYNVPVLVRLTVNERDVMYYSIGRGADLRVSKADGVTPVAYQIERWDSAANKAEIWVLVDTLKANDSTQNVRLHWNKTGVTSRSSGPDVFQTSNGFAGVWHLAAESDSSRDATANKNNAYRVGATTTAEGAVGSARDYNWAGDGDMDAVKLNQTFNMSANDRVTVSAWVRRTSANTVGATEGIAALFDWYQEGATPNKRSYGLLHQPSNSNNPGFSFHVSANGADGANEVIVSSGIVAEDNVWTHVTGTADGTSLNIYLNGEFQASQAFSGNIFFPSSLTNAQPFAIGFFDKDQYFNGVIDEVRLSNVARSEDWVKMEFLNQKAGSTVVRYGTTTPTPPPMPPLTVSSAPRAVSSAFSAVRRGDGMLFNLPSTGEAGTLSLIDAQGRAVWSASVAAGAKQFVWNGLAAQGRLSAGVYTARFVSAGHTHARTITQLP